LGKTGTKDMESMHAKVRCMQACKSEMHAIMQACKSEVHAIMHTGKREMHANMQQMRGMQLNGEIEEKSDLGIGNAMSRL
jgi:uncharacterized protein (UPF0262 family)